MRSAMLVAARSDIQRQTVMPIVNTRDVVGYAKASGSAVPIIDIKRAGDVVDALATAEALKTPLVLAVAGNASSDFGFEIGMLAIEAAADGP